MCAASLSQSPRFCLSHQKETERAQTACDVLQWPHLALVTADCKTHCNSFLAKFSTKFSIFTDSTKRCCEQSAKVEASLSNILYPK